MPNHLTSLDEISRPSPDALLRVPLEPHGEIKFGKPKESSGKSPKHGGKKKAAPKPARTPAQRPPNPKPNWRGTAN
jgi:hypothetical protein